VRLHFQSIIARIAALYIVTVAAACIAMPLALYYLLKSAVDELHRSGLAEQATEISRFLHFTEGKWELRLPSELADAFAEAYGRYSYAVIDRDGRVLFSSLSSQAPLTERDPLRGDAFYFYRKRDAKDIAGASVPFTIDGNRIWIQTAEDLAHRDVQIDDVVAEFFPRVGWITAPFLVVLLLIEIAIVRSGLRPILAASHLAARIGPMATDIRLPESGIPHEILPLVHAVNAALDRLEQGFRAQREFTANAAHELRTPLAILRTNVDLLSDDITVKALRQDIDTMSRLVDQLLNAAETDALVIGPTETADLRAVCTEIVAYMAPLAVKLGKSLAIAEDSAHVLIRGNADFLGRAVRNLVENALSHTKPGTTVEVRVTADPAILVLDEGPGVPMAEREVIFQRFWRRDQRRRGNFGLGLSIVSRIADAHRGWVSVDNRPTGGAVFSIQFDPSVVIAMSETSPGDVQPSGQSPQSAGKLAGAPHVTAGYQT